MKRAISLAMLVVTVCFAQTTLSLPLLGVVRDSTGHFRKVFGAPGAFVLGPPEPMPGVVAVSASTRTANVTVRLENQGRELVLVYLHGVEKRISLPATAGQPQVMSENWLAAFPFVIHLTTGCPEIYRLPEPSR